MRSSLRALALAVVLSPCVIGCAEPEVQAGEPAFPPGVGYASDPPQAPPPPPSAPPAAYGQDPQAYGAGWQGPPQEVTIGGQEGDQYADTDPSALTDFRSTLDPYGSWTEDPTYGTVWVPSTSVVGTDFTPYVTGGHWGYDSDYVWVSDYDWGWAPFHYGRWVYGPASWEWIPGRAYAGAWTSWRYGVGEWGYVGWAPLPPTWGWRGGVAVGLGFVPAAPYSFVAHESVFAPNVGAHLVAGTQVGAVAAHTQPYVPASGGLGGHSLAHPSVGGPPPAALHIQAADVARANVTDRGLSQARAFSRPSTATPLGARAPQQAASRAATGAYATGGSRVPSYAPGASHFGGKLGAGFSGSVASAAPGRGYSGGSRPYFGSASSYPGRSSGFSGSGGYRGGGGGGFHSSGGSSFHGGGSAFHSSGGGFHGGGGGGGFHGGGGGGHGGGHR